jgi:SAM-dependent methyltransferase
MWHYVKNDPRILTMDIRKEEPQKLSNGATFEVAPDIVGDVMDLPFPAGAYDLVLFDPPHVNCGHKSFLYKKYGSLDKDWREFLTLGFSECFRVLREAGTLIFKWSDSSIPLKRILELTPEKPVITHSAKSNSGKRTTYFCVFYKEAAPGA